MTGQHPAQLSALLELDERRWPEVDKRLHKQTHARSVPHAIYLCARHIPWPWTGSGDWDAAEHMRGRIRVNPAFLGRRARRRLVQAMAYWDGTLTARRFRCRGRPDRVTATRQVGVSLPGSDRTKPHRSKSSDDRRATSYFRAKPGVEDEAALPSGVGIVGVDYALEEGAECGVAHLNRTVSRRRAAQSAGQCAERRPAPRRPGGLRPGRASAPLGAPVPRPCLPALPAPVAPSRPKAGGTRSALLTRRRHCL